MSEPKGNENMAWDIKRGAYIWEDAASGATFVWDSNTDSWQLDTNSQTAGEENEPDVTEGYDPEVPSEQIQNQMNQIFLETQKQMSSNAEENKEAKGDAERKEEGKEEGKEEAEGKENDKDKEMKEEKKKRKRKAKKKKQNFTLYVTGLPKDVTDEEFIKFCTTAGVIAKDPVTRLPKIKIYKDDQGVPKGDAIVSFLKAPSIDNAFKLLDGFDFRPPENHVVKLELAKFENKPFKPKPKTAPLSKKQKRYNQEEAELGWEDKEQRHVIIKHMFDPRVAEKDFSFYENLEKEIAVEFARIGQVDALKIFERNEEGVVAVKYKYEYDAEKCIEIMNGRWFDGRQLSAAFYDGYSNYFVAETDEQKEEREKQWDKWLVGNDEFNDREGKQTGPTTTEIEEREIPDKMGQ